MKYRAVRSERYPSEWVVEAIGSDGEGYVTIFAGPLAEERAREYASLGNTNKLSFWPNTRTRRGMNNRLIAFFRNNVEGRHGNDAEGEPCDLLMETEYSGPVHPETGEELRCTCGYDEFEVVMRVAHPMWFAEEKHE